MSDAGAEAHNFDRRKTDARFAALDTRVTALEGWAADMDRKLGENTSELRANSEMTKQALEKTDRVHEAMFGREDDDDDQGVKGKVGEMHGLLTEAKSAVKFATRICDGAARLGRPIAYLTAAAVALGVWWKTGEWRWPPW